MNPCVDVLEYQRYEDKKVHITIALSIDYFLVLEYVGTRWVKLAEYQSAQLSERDRCMFNTLSNEYRILIKTSF